MREEIRLLRDLGKLFNFFLHLAYLSVCGGKKTLWCKLAIFKEMKTKQQIERLCLWIRLQHRGHAPSACSSLIGPLGGAGPWRALVTLQSQVVGQGLCRRRHGWQCSPACALPARRPSGASAGGITGVAGPGSRGPGPRGLGHGLATASAASREDAPRVARFVTHVSDWGALATISTLEAVRGRSFADVISFSDGPPGAGSGVPYMYLSPMQQLVSDLQVSRSAARFPGLDTAGLEATGRPGSEPLKFSSLRSAWVLEIKILNPAQMTGPSGQQWLGGDCSIPDVGQLHKVRLLVF